MQSKTQSQNQNRISADQIEFQQADRTAKQHIKTPFRYPN
jgi:hypothetical protein